jgi:hypothetical protein
MRLKLKSWNAGNFCDRRYRLDRGCAFPAARSGEQISPRLGIFGGARLSAFSATRKTSKQDDTKSSQFSSN